MWNFRKTDSVGVSRLNRVGAIALDPYLSPLSQHLCCVCMCVCLYSGRPRAW